MLVTRALRVAAGAAADLLFPARCVHCGEPGRLLCDRCIGISVRLTGPACRSCAAPMPSGDRCWRCAERPPATSRTVALFQMDGPIRTAVHRLKYEDLRAVAPVLGDLMAAHPALDRVHADVVMPVPLHRRRLRSRGYNHAELLARPVAVRLGVHVDTRTLRRVRASPPQVEAADEAERRLRVADAFEAGAAASGKRVLLVDDVCTTGATLDACARALKRAGAAWVGALVLAKEL
ncbi:MAG: ComF family protein [Gemmatimonadetes bacterium]|nr:ComF family protein [Gemmatimonadota bacterium]